MLDLKTLSPYLLGTQFHNSLVVQLKRPEKQIVDRLDRLCELVRGKTVLHLGFADHLPLIPEKDKQGRWLHRLLCTQASRCIGVDIDKEAVEYVRTRMQIPDVFCMDITSDELPDAVSAAKWDYVILGELLEHIDNPVAFLASIHDRLKTIAENLVITVPNAFDAANLRFLRKNCEYTNSDHRYWFTPYTLAKVAVRGGYSVREMTFAQNFKYTTFWQRLLLRKYPMTHETLIGVFGFAE